MTAMSGCTDLLESDPTIAAASNLDETHLGTVENEHGEVNEIWVSFSQLSISWEGMPDTVEELEIRVLLQDMGDLVFEHIEPGDWDRGDSHEFSADDGLGGELLEETSLTADSFRVDEDGAEETFSIPLHLEVSLRDTAGDLLHTETFDLLVEFTVVNRSEDPEDPDDQMDDSVGDDPNDVDDPADEDLPADDEDEPADDIPPNDEDSDNDVEEDTEDPGVGDDPNGNGADDDPPEDNVITGAIEFQLGGTYEIGEDFTSDADEVLRNASGEVVVIEGRGHTISGNGENLCVSNVHGDMTIRNLVITDFEQCATDGDVVAPTPTYFEGVTFRDSSIGFRSFMPEPLEVIDCVFRDLEIAFDLYDSWDNGPFIQETHFVGCDTVMQVDIVNDVRIEDSTVEDCGELMISSGSIEHCDFEFSSGGVRLAADPSGGFGGGEFRMAHTTVSTPDTAFTLTYGNAVIRRCDLDGDMAIDFGESVHRDMMIVHSNILGPCQFDPTAMDEDPRVEATCNWWGDATGPSHPDNPLDDPLGVETSGDVDFEPWMTEAISDDTDLDARCEGPLEPSMEAEVDIGGSVA